MQMITHSGVIAGVLAIDMFALLMYNVAGMCVTGHLGAVFRQVCKRMRAGCSLRGVDSIRVYGSPSSSFGQEAGTA